MTVEYEDVPPPRGADIRCRAVLSLISPGTELACLRGEFDPDTNWAQWVVYPFRPGYSMAAIVVDVGEDVTAFASGDRVLTYAGHQEFFTVPESKAERIPDDIDNAEAVWVALAVTAGAGVMRAALELGEKVGVIGAGPVGQLVLQYTAAEGASVIAVIDPDTHRLAMAKTHGATNTFAVAANEAVAHVAELTNGSMLDVVFDVTGSPSVLSAATRLVRPRGRIVLLGDTPTPSRQALGPGVVSNSLTILGAHADLASWDPKAGNFTRKAVTSVFFRRLIEGSFRVRDMVGTTASPIGAAETYNRLQNGGAPAGAICFDWSQIHSEGIE